ncbi:flagellar hook-associated protein FlgL [Maridesulfovibrio hydrothermalis]|uniref:Flagellar hook-associated protein 3 n=1 Tax=Maridesulfovibrio hydrothermalis AM13 = DSM 14728 TaxID=1121451 RepID=L0RCS9_9BACT|nr:flagellar hook-associated protein FlgL [Maridesulfovibrio hydrothermalis]CCO23990.1 Flagellar hook-associated protein 3 [Maridesulfovibrio hydrothermalis AM13 = DSM 14728]
MRVSQQMLFNTYVSNMNRSLTDLVDTNIKAQTQKKVNKPSDDPVGMARILDHRETLATVKQYRNNIDTAKGWLSLSDTTLTQASAIITRARELAQQAASGTISGDNREEISYEARQLFQQLISLSNTEYEGKSIYAGHKVDQNAFEQTLGMTTNDSNVSSRSYSITGNAEKTIVVQFLDSGTVGGGADLDYRYSKDGGDTFITKTLTAGDTTLDFDGVTMSLENGTTVAANSATDTNDTTGTWMWIRPAAKYLGDDQDAINVNGMNTSLGGGRTKAEGVFTSDVVVRIDSAARLQSNISYSYSLDGGTNWTTGNVKTADGSASNAVLSIPGGTLTIYSNAGVNLLGSGAQFVIRPDTAAINLQIQENEYVRINDVGKDIFGGVYQAPGQSNASPALDSNNTLTGSGASPSKNLLETMGNLVAFLETNNQHGVQQVLESLGLSQKHLLTKTADVGGRENRLAVADNVLSSLELNEKERISHIEDIDVGELMIQLSQQQIVYEAVLKSSSMIMKLNLLNYV